MTYQSGEDGTWEWGIVAGFLRHDYISVDDRGKQGPWIYLDGEGCQCDGRVASDFWKEWAFGRDLLSSAAGHLTRWYVLLLRFVALVFMAGLQAHSC